MIKARPRHLTYSNVLATSAIVLAMAGGGTAAFAAGSLVKNSVGHQQIKAGAVRTGELANGAVKGGKIADGSVRSADLAAGAVGADEIGGGVVGGEKLADKSVSAKHLADNSVTGVAVDESSLTQVPSAETANSVRGMMRVSVDANGKVFSFSAPTEPTVGPGPGAISDARVVRFPGVDVTKCSLLPSVAQNVPGGAGRVLGAATAWLGGDATAVVVETHPDFNKVKLDENGVPVLDENGQQIPTRHDDQPKPFTLLVMC